MKSLRLSAASLALLTCSLYSTVSLLVRTRARSRVRSASESEWESLIASLGTLASLHLVTGSIYQVRASNSSDLLTPEQPAISFFWGTYNDSQVELPQCNGMQVITTLNQASSRQVVPPLYFTAFPIGYPPLTMRLPTDDVSQRFTWNADYPVGTHLTLAMSDSANNSGGAVDGFSIVRSSLMNCTGIVNEGSPISFVASPSNDPCDEIDIEIKGGKAPYTVSVLAGQSGLYGNLTGVTKKSFKMRNSVAARQTFNLLVTDSKGVSSTVGPNMVSALNLQTCNRPTSFGSDSSTPIGAIVGAVVGGVVLAVILGLVAWWFIRRRNKKREEEYRQAQLVASSEYRNADGRAPLVEPFMLQTQGPNVRNTGLATQYSETSPTNDGSYDKSLDKYPSSPSNHYSGEPLGPSSQQYYSHPSHQTQQASISSSQFDHHQPPPPSASYAYSNPYDPYDSSAPASTSNGGYAPYDTSSQHAPMSTASLHYEPPQHSNSSATDDLANPEEFEFRLPDPRGGGGYNLPPGARPYR
ncbi:hypothetical protein JCM3766R1_006896 [Sporobolomyces carnicolor]